MSEQLLFEIAGENHAAEDEGIEKGASDGPVGHFWSKLWSFFIVAI